MLCQRLHRTGVNLRRTCAILAILSASVAGVAVARNFEGAVIKSDDVRVSVDRVEIGDHTVTLGVQAENQSNQTIYLNNLNTGNGLTLSDDRGGRYLLLPPATNRTLMVEPHEVMSGDLVFFGPVGQDLPALTLTTGVPGADGKPLELTMNAAPGEERGTIVQSAGADGPLALNLDGKASVPAGVELKVNRIELVPEGYQVNTVVDNRSGSMIALNQNNGLSLRDNLGNTYRLQPPSGNQTVMIPPNGSLEGKFLFQGQPSPLAEHVVLTTDPLQGQPFEIVMPVPATAQRLAFTDDGTVGMVLDNIKYEGDLVTVDAMIANLRNEPVVFNRALGLRLHDNHGNLYPVMAPPGNTVTEIPAGGMALAHYIFAGPIASDVHSLTLSTNAVGDGGQQGPNLQFELPVLAAAPGPDLPESKLKVSRLQESTVRLEPIGQSTTSRVQQLRSGLGARQTNEGTLVALQGDVLFDIDSAVIRSDAKPLLSQLAEFVRLMDVDEVMIAGYTDTTGDADYNLRLSRQRANAVSDYLKERGALNHVNVLVQGRGEQQPVATNQTAEGRQQNRRVEITLREGRQG
jgi:outer membrane protein OmpA-like peptidoglycan-associated protein